MGRVAGKTTRRLRTCNFGDKPEPRSGLGGCLRRVALPAAAAESNATSPSRGVIAALEGPASSRLQAITLAPEAMGRRPCTTSLPPPPVLAVLAGALSLLSTPVWAQGGESATRSYENDLNDVLKVAVEKLLPLVSDFVTRPEVSTDCSTSMLKTFVALRQQKAWAVRMAMSNAMYAPNALEGTYVAMGGYDQCLHTRHRPNGAMLVPYFTLPAGAKLYFSLMFSNVVKGRSCVLSMSAGPHVSFITQGRLDPLTASSPDREGVDTLGGLCAPSLCTRQDMTFLVRSLISEYGGNATVTSCSTDDAKVVTSVQAFSMLVVPAMVIILVAFLLPLFAYGPAADEAYNQYIYGCYNKWWAVLLQANNFDNSEHVCLQHLWYINAELQIFLVLAFPLALLFIKQPRVAAIIGALMAAAFCLMTCVQIYSWDLFYAFTSGTNDMRRVKDTLELIYFRPFTHVGAYIIGVMCGYVAAQYNNVTIRPNVEMGLWLVSLALACGVLFASFPWNQGHLPDAVTNALYGGFHRLLWALAFFWPSYACATDL
ncbi:hypothetical protein HPB49_017119 [Dermacentor silvarum]|uniref:Uncharacterized protein n=1 Tax=Dermacentor silvarum TaxID=543639 RepID=A0ACB8E1P1_DERSI|nr:hypothetical protein HPB49_017119 [Dermacentor silvarum]